MRACTPSGAGAFARGRNADFYRLIAWLDETTVTTVRVTASATATRRAPVGHPRTSAPSRCSCAG
jgi:hypothetical protein